jgi:hypothetical protein
MTTNVNLETIGARPKRQWTNFPTGSPQSHGYLVQAGLNRGFIELISRRNIHGISKQLASVQDSSTHVADEGRGGFRR